MLMGKIFKFLMLMGKIFTFLMLMLIAHKFELYEQVSMLICLWFQNLFQEHPCLPYGKSTCSLAHAHQSGSLYNTRQVFHKYKCLFFCEIWLTQDKGTSFDLYK